MRSLTLAALVILSCACDAGVVGCRQACDRPFQLAEQRAKHRSSAWERLPVSLRGRTEAIAASWRTELKEARARFAASCVSACEDGAATSQVECLKRAGNVGEWKRCSK